VSPRREPVDLDALIRHAKSAPESVNESEARLDELLAHAATKDGPQDAAAAPVKVDPFARLRELFATTLNEVIDDLRRKYGPGGVNLGMDASNFVGGGRTITITIAFGGQGTRLDGTVMSSAIAFQQTRYLQNEHSGITGSGPTLRTRNLDAETFRSFMCERIATLVRSVMKHAT